MELYITRVLELPNRRVRVADVGDMHCGGCRMFAGTRNWCALFGKDIDVDNQVRVPECLEAEVQEDSKGKEPDPDAGPIETVAWRPR